MKLVFGPTKQPTRFKMTWEEYINEVILDATDEELRSLYGIEKISWLPNNHIALEVNDNFGHTVIDFGLANSVI